MRNKIIDNSYIDIVKPSNAVNYLIIIYLNQKDGKVFRQVGSVKLNDTTTINKEIDLMLEIIEAEIKKGTFEMSGGKIDNLTTLKELLND